MNSHGIGMRIPPASLAITAMLLIQLANALSVTLIDDIGSAGTVWLRLCFGALFLVAIARPRLRSIRAKDVPLLLALGLVTALMSSLFLAALERIPVGTAVALEFLGPLLVAALAAKRRSALLWPVLALVGIIVLTEPWTGEIDVIGVGIALAAGACWGLYNVCTQLVGDRFSGLSGLALTIPIAAVFTTIIGLPQVIGGSLTWGVVFTVAGIALLAPVISFALEMVALRRMTHNAFGTLLSFEPAFAVVIGLLVLSQAPTVMQIVGITIVAIAGVASQRGGRRGAAPLEGASDLAVPVTDPTP